MAQRYDIREQAPGRCGGPNQILPGDPAAHIDPGQEPKGGSPRRVGLMISADIVEDHRHQVVSLQFFIDILRVAVDLSMLSPISPLFSPRKD